MAKKSEYNCILYDVGDQVQEKHGSNEILEIEATRMSNVGVFTCQFLRFKDKPEDTGAFSNLYIPASNSIEKYKDGLKYFDEVKVKTQRKEAVARGNKVHSMLATQIKQRKNELTAEDLKPRVSTIGFFNARPPIKENND